MAKKRILRKYDARKLIWLKTIRLLIILVLILFLALRYLVGFSVVSGVSMRDTLVDGDIVLYSRLTGSVKVGDVVSVSLPSGEYYVKRVVAMGGDTIDMIDGTLYINDQPEPAGHFKGETYPEEGAFSYPYTVQEGDLFVIGDNRPESVDSRYFGAVSARQVTGLLKIRIGKRGIGLL